MMQIMMMRTITTTKITSTRANREIPFTSELIKALKYYLNLSEEDELEESVPEVEVPVDVVAAILPDDDEDLLEGLALFYVVVLDEVEVFDDEVLACWVWVAEVPEPELAVVWVCTRSASAVRRCLFIFNLAK